MSKSSIPRFIPHRNNKADVSALFRTFATNPFDAIRDEWLALREEEASAPSWRLAAIARRHMVLLSAYPENEQAQMIDRLNAAVEEIAHAVS